jgi:hypothetical protein
MRSKRLLSALAAMGLSAGLTHFAAAANAPLASGTITGSGTHYSLTLTDSASSTSPIGSIWEAWIPGQFYMTSTPTAITSPAGWTSNETPGGGGNAIQWIASSTAFDVPIGGSLSGFGFTSPDSNVEGISTVDAGIPTQTTVAYDAGLFSDNGTTFVFAATAVPEPTTLALLAPAALMLLRRKRQAVL